MKSLNSYLSESRIDESIIGIGATIWAIGKIAGVAALGLTIPISVCSAIMKKNAHKKEVKRITDEFNAILDKYKDYLLDPDECPKFSALMKDQLNKDTDITELSGEIIDEIRNVLKSHSEKNVNGVPVDLIDFNQMYAKLAWNN